MPTAAPLNSIAQPPLPGVVAGPRDKPARYIEPANDMSVAEALAAFPATTGQTIKILRPSAVLSPKTYSAPMTVPLGPAYLAGILEAAGYGVDIIDGVGEAITDIRFSPDRMVKVQGLSTEAIIERVGPEVNILCVSMMFSQEWVQTREVINAIKKAHSRLLIVAGGEHPTSMPEFVLGDCPAIDFVITGEGELSLLEFLWRHLNGEPQDSLPGLVYRQDDGEIANNGLGRRIKDFANLPRPAWHLCPVDNYFTGAWTHGIAYGRNMLILATRGCPYQCTFCSNPGMWTTRYMMRPADEVVDEIEWLVETYGANSIDFADLTAIVKKKWVLDFCAEIERRNLDIVWQLPSGTRSEALDEETLQAIYDSGCQLLTYAPESGSAETLRIIKKKIDLDDMAESLKHAVRIGHTVKVNLILGFPHEGRRHCWTTIFYGMKAAAFGVHDCIVSVFTPYPGSQLYDELRTDGIILKVDDQYFYDLILYFDLTVGRSFSRHMPGWETAMYRIIGMAAFYLTSFALHPGRAFRLISMIWKKDFQPQTILEQRVKDLVMRMRLETVD